MSTDHMEASSSTNPLTTFDSDTTDDHGESQDNVVHGGLTLIPRCWRHHGGFKGKGHEGNTFGLPLHAHLCGRFEECDQFIIWPFSKSRSHYNLTTTDAEADLRRWFLTPNEGIDAPPEDDARNRTFVQYARYTDAMLLSCLDLGIQQIQLETAHVRSLIAYALRDPYSYDLRRWMEDFDPLWESLHASEFRHAKRDGLQQDLVQARKQLGFVRQRVRQLCQRIVNLKKIAAKNGDWAEIHDLLRLEYVDEEWVQQKCSV